MATESENRRLVQAIDHTKLTFQAGEDENASIERLCREAEQFGFYAVCVRPQHVSVAKASLGRSVVCIAVVIGFPSGKVKLENELENPTVGQAALADKIREAKQSIQDGADELDWVINVSNLKKDVAEGTRLILEELSAGYQSAGGKPIKVIIETDLLNVAEIVAVTQWCAETGMAMVKTSTGMVEGGQGATIENIEHIRNVIQRMNKTTGIKASGGIKTRQQALSFLDLGVNRLGTSSGVQILENDFARKEQEAY